MVAEPEPSRVGAGRARRRSGGRGRSPAAAGRRRSIAAGQRDRAVEPGRVARARARGRARRCRPRARRPAGRAAGPGRARRGAAASGRCSPSARSRRSPTSGPPSPVADARTAAGETWPTKSWSSQRGTARAGVDGRVSIDSPGRRDDRPQAAGRPQVPRERPRVDAGDGRDRVVAQQRGELAGVIEHGRGRVGDDEAAEPRPDATGRRRAAGRSCRSAGRS